MIKRRHRSVIFAGLVVAIATIATGAAASPPSGMFTFTDHARAQVAGQHTLGTPDGNLPFHFEPPATDEEIRAASIQFVRKLSGFTQPSKANEAAFNKAVEEVAQVARRLIDSLVTTAAPRDREEWAARARARAAERYDKRAV